ncbi:MAG: amino acid-binding protein [Deltaproteobacteria bacterium]|nr:amino acid-binding protein [Deltaproteobacteria bacterium]
MELKQKAQVMRQYSVSLENRVGALAELCAVVAQESINLLAICAIDTVEEAVLRIVAERQEETKSVLEKQGFRVIDTEVLVVELDNNPGATGRVAALLSQNGINIDYLYASAHPQMDRAICIFRLQDLERALEVVNAHSEDT